ncbi:Serine/threonine-protein kinase STE20 [Choanephora cucurbitarum]|uniref:non-specific serine/threonine protein kinase n=1 Tax=Choanephora cucurbitarum TaxID=101091 RepID=A0A1C7MZZ3_9FUNG|nr:Serine/threonine-protein kinase STE20 [Choanephora cucurbitarum]
MSTSPTLFNTSSSSAATRLASPQQKIMDSKSTIKPRRLRNSTINTNSHKSNTTHNNHHHHTNTNNMHSKKAPWRVPGNFEIPDIIKEAWEKNKNRLLNHTQQQQQQQQQLQQKKKAIENKPMNQAQKRWIPVGRSPSIIPLPPPIVKVKRKLHAEFDAKLRKVLPGSKIMDLNPKEQFEGLCQVGSGANGAVVRAVRKHTKTHVAIKRCYIEDQDTPHHAYILRELRIMGCLNHPNLIQLKEAALWEDHLWMCMELMSCSVFNLLYNTTTGLSEGNAIRIARECLEGLVYLHSKNYMHRDIKCENILLSRNGQVKLADFGLATPINKTNTSRLGTAKWMAPEVVSESPYRENVDIWSLAITIIEMMDRVPPLYYLEDTQDIYADILYGDPPKFNFSIPSKGVSDMVRWMLTHNGMTRPGAKAVLKRMNSDIKKGVLECTKQKELAYLVREVFPDSVA